MDSKFSAKELFDILVEDAQQPFSGWDFSYIKDRIVTEPFTWSYSAKIIPFVRTANSLLDMGTGGGEFLFSLQPLPKHTFATEAYEPNVPVAKKRLEPIGCKVVQISEISPLPFEDEQFDLIINRHEEYSSSEIFRILKSGGYFITQQVGSNNDYELNRYLGDFSEEEHANWNLDYAVNELQDAGLTILEKKDDTPKTRCFDIGAIIYYLLAIPWQIPDFSVEKYREKLFELHLEILEKEYIELTSTRFLIVAKKS